MDNKNIQNLLSTQDIKKSLTETTEDHQVPTQKSLAAIEQPSKLKVIISNTCLLVWAIVLAVIGMQAVSGKASTVILDIAELFVPGRKVNLSDNVVAPSSFTNLTPGQGNTAFLSSSDGTVMMNEYIAQNYPGENKTAIPPIAIVLDQLQVNVNWRDADAIDLANGENGKAPSRNDYINLFDIVAKRLEAIADFSPKVSVSSSLKLKNSILPRTFRSTQFQEQDIDLPVEAVLWVSARQEETAARKSQISFLDLFVLLIILGGFGSWIYLVRKHINSENVKLQEYFYRPPLGMTLAIAVFIVNLTLHSFVSTSNISEVRRETLILLAFAAGLLSDKTYEFIEKVTGEKIGNRTPGEGNRTLGEDLPLTLQAKEQKDTVGTNKNRMPSEDPPVTT